MTNGGVAVVEGRGQERILQILNIEHKRLGERGVVAFVQFVVEIDVFAFLIDPALVRVPPRGVHQVGQHLNVGFVGDIQDVKARVHAATVESRATERDLSSCPWAAVVGHDLSVVHIAGIPLPHKSRCGGIRQVVDSKAVVAASASVQESAFFVDGHIVRSRGPSRRHSVDQRNRSRIHVGQRDHLDALTAFTHHVAVVLVHLDVVPIAVGARDEPDLLGRSRIGDLVDEHAVVHGDQRVLAS